MTVVDTTTGEALDRAPLTPHPYADKFPMLPDSELVLEGFSSDPICNVMISESLAHPGFYDVKIYIGGECVELTRPCRGREAIARFVQRETRGICLDWRMSPRVVGRSARESGVVYFIRDEDGYIKIGTAGSAESRLAALQTAHRQRLTLLATLPGERTEELALHRRFASAHVRGEWFRPTPDLVHYIKAVS